MVFVRLWVRALSPPSSRACERSPRGRLRFQTAIRFVSIAVWGQLGARGPCGAHFFTCSRLFHWALVVILFWVYRSATPGKMIFRMKIIDDKTGGKPTTKQWIIRYFGYFVCTLSLGLGFVWINFSKKCQGWHDMMAGTVVVRLPKNTKSH